MDYLENLRTDMSEDIETEYKEDTRELLDLLNRLGPQAAYKDQLDPDKRRFLLECSVAELAAFVRF